MPVSAQLVTEQGEVLAEVEGFDRLIPFASSDSVCWRFIDPYGDTVFNRTQMGPFIEEAGQLADSATEPESRSLSALVALAERCRDGVHLYLKFIGD